MRTTTHIHSENALRAQRANAFMRDQFKLCGMTLYAQLALGTALFLFRRTSTPSYMAVLLTLPVVLGLVAFSNALSNAAKPGVGVFRSFLPPALASAGSVLLALSLFIDAQIVLYCFCAIVTHILPQSSLLRISVTLALAVPLAIRHGDESALGRVAGFSGLILIAVILLTIVTALPFGDFGHMFPLFGKGVDTVLTGFMWLAGAASCAAVPYLLPTNRKSLDMLTDNKKPRLVAVMFAVIAASLSALMRAFLLPYYALSRPETLGTQIMIMPEVSPSIIGWSMYVTVLVLLLVIVFAAAVTACSAFLRDAFGKRNVKSTLTPFLIALAAVPLAALNLKNGRTAIIMIAPYRLALTLLPLLAAGASALIGKKGGRRS